MSQLRVLLLLVSCQVVFAAAAGAETMTISYFERPPYYYTAKNGRPEGFLLNKVVGIMEQAEVEARLLSLTPNQILYVVRHAVSPHCSIGWFKNSQREEFAKFSRPIYQDKPVLLLIRKSGQERIGKDHTLAAIFANSSLIFARNIHYSYGDYIDGLLREKEPESYLTVKGQASLIQAIAADDRKYILVAPEEAATLIRRASYRQEDFALVPLADVPVGNKRYLMCSQSVSDELLERINQAIDRTNQ